MFHFINSYLPPKSAHALKKALKYRNVIETMVIVFVDRASLVTIVIDAHGARWAKRQIAKSVANVLIAGIRQF